jgi:guanylate kinase
MLFVIAAPSGAGKTSIVKSILTKNKSLIFSVSATTRMKREDEIDGKDYFFLQRDDYK